MTTDLCTDAAVVHITTPQIITNESVVSVSAGVRGPPAASGGAVGLGRRLLLAARAGDTPLVLDLMAKGAPFTTDWLGTSPLHLAASNAHAETCGVLLRAGVSRDSRTKVDRTPLHLAAYAGHATVAALLLEHGALVDCRDMLRMTPLHWAAERGHAACCAVLLRHGADARLSNKFHKSPAQLAAAKGHGEVLALIDDALKQREAARSVRALVADRMPEENTEPQRPAYATVHAVQEVKIKPKPIQEKPSKPETKDDEEPGGEEQKSPGSVGAAALLRRHGITLLPADDGSTLLNALQSGRTVVLSDAGKLMLKESGDSPSAAAAPPIIPPVVSQVSQPGAAGAGRGRGVVLTATPVRAPPPGVKVFTLNNRQQRRLTLQDSQVKFVQLPAEARVVSPRKAVRARRVAPAGPAAARAPVKIIMNKTNFERLVAGARRDPPDAAAPKPTSVVVTPDLPGAAGEAETSAARSPPAAGSARALAAELAAARSALAALAEELRECRARLAHYEPPE